VAEAGDVPSLDPLVESRDGSTSSDTESLVRHILRLPKVPYVATNCERAGDETRPSSSVGASAPKGRRGEADSTAGAVTLVPVKKVRMGL
jgi:hypothetical protein